MPETVTIGKRSPHVSMTGRRSIYRGYRERQGFVLSKGYFFIKENEFLKIYVGLTRRNALGGGVHEPQQSEFSVCFYRSAVIFGTFNLTSFLIDLPYQG
jgi:hypothetical protein